MVALKRNAPTIAELKQQKLQKQQIPPATFRQVSAQQKRQRQTGEALTQAEEQQMQENLEKAKQFEQDLARLRYNALRNDYPPLGEVSRKEFNYRNAYFAKMNQMMMLNAVGMAIRDDKMGPGATAVAIALSYMLIPGIRQGVNQRAGQFLQGVGSHAINSKGKPTRMGRAMLKLGGFLTDDAAKQKAKSNGRIVYNEDTAAMVLIRTDQEYVKMVKGLNQESNKYKQLRANYEKQIMWLMDDFKEDGLNLQNVTNCKNRYMDLFSKIEAEGLLENPQVYKALKDISVSVGRPVEEMVSLNTEVSLLQNYGPKTRSSKDTLLVEAVDENGEVITGSDGKPKTFDTGQWDGTIVDANTKQLIPGVINVEEKHDFGTIIDNITECGHSKAVAHFKGEPFQDIPDMLLYQRQLMETDLSPEQAAQFTIISHNSGLFKAYCEKLVDNYGDGAGPILSIAKDLSIAREAAVEKAVSNANFDIDVYDKMIYAGLMRPPLNLSDEDNFLYKLGVNSGIDPQKLSTVDYPSVICGISSIITEIVSSEAPFVETLNNMDRHSHLNQMYGMEFSKTLEATKHKEAATSMVSQASRVISSVSSESLEKNLQAAREGNFLGYDLNSIDLSRASGEAGSPTHNTYCDKMFVEI